MKKSSNKNKGFTILELLVVMAIIAILSSLIFINYRQSGKQFALRRQVHKVAQDIRRAGELAMGAKEFSGGVPAGGYGIYFNPTPSTSYLLFADANANYSYDGPSEIYETIYLEKNVSLQVAAPITITFTPPDPTIRINQTMPNEAVITLTSDGKTASVTVNTAGLIDID